MPRFKRKTKTKAARVSVSKKAVLAPSSSAVASIESKRFCFWLSLKHWMQRIALVVGALGVLYGGYSVRFSGKIFPGVRLGNLALGGMTSEQAAQLVRSYGDAVHQVGIRVVIDDHTTVIRAVDIGFSLDPEMLAERAFFIGRNPHGLLKMFERLTAPFLLPTVSPGLPFDREALQEEVGAIADRFDEPRVDVRFIIEGTTVRVFTDTRPGRLVPRSAVIETLSTQLSRLEPPVVATVTIPDLPHIDPASAAPAKEEIERMISAPLTLTSGSLSILVERPEIGVWIVPGYDARILRPLLNEQMIREYVAALARGVNTPVQDIRVKVQDGKVIDFLPPQQGKALQEDETVESVRRALEDRRSGARVTQAIVLPFLISEPRVDETAQELGIRELIGKATTPFVGSPVNRISNIKNGVAFLSGVLIPPGETFSTLATLGKVDNTTGYLPELVIKGDRTIPEFGGGLCQVSTTLFRAVLDAGLPVVERQNHSYRVSYYEKDGDGKRIGPGLDATIYSPRPDFQFLNDTGHTILIQGSVEGTLATFELYGTRDGRSAHIDGPKTLSTSPSGEPVFIETDALPEGEKKQIERAHPGGSAIATYRVQYPDGAVKEQVFKSYYRPWPEKYLIGKKRDLGSATSTPSVMQAP